ncbi:MAG: PEP-CTERM sorting domain-containing protein, partial [Planctomycetes bacterium]|nr:PEP-CTERM sorting domain-containing protein [Planctomycetota bacterium]
YFVNGLDGTFLGEGFAVSGDGTRAYGMSPVSDGRPGNWPFMITNPGASQTIVELPTFPDTGGSVTNGVVYGASMDGQYASGMNYRGTEKAVLWDTVNMTITDLTDYFSGQGMLGNFTRLSRAYSVAADGSGNIWVTGQGVWTPDGGATNYTRGFVALIPEPSTMLFLGLGGLALLRRRH